MLIQRPRRNRKSPSIRALLEETKLTPSDLVAPLFVVEGAHQKQPIVGLPNVYRYSLDLLWQECRRLEDQGIHSVLLFPCLPDEAKDAAGSICLDKDNVLHRAVDLLKAKCPHLTLMVDIALDPYTDHGHDGLIDASGYVLNDPTLDILAPLSVSLAEAGADVVAPSDMMDGRVASIRKALDGANQSQVSILAYTAKYASAFYGPFRNAVQSQLTLGDKKSYQLNPANSREALLEACLDEKEGADMLLVKPALLYLDILSKIKERTHLPVGAYHVSGEYAMLHEAARNHLLDYDKALYESMIAIKRAGADFVITYAIADLLPLLH